AVTHAARGGAARVGRRHRHGDRVDVRHHAGDRPRAHEADLRAARDLEPRRARSTRRRRRPLRRGATDGPGAPRVSSSFVPRTSSFPRRTLVGASTMRPLALFLSALLLDRRSWDLVVPLLGEDVEREFVEAPTPDPSLAPDAALTAYEARLADRL